MEIGEKRFEFDTPPTVRLNAIQSNNNESGNDPDESEKDPDPEPPAEGGGETGGGGSSSGGSQTSLGSGNVVFTQESYWWGYTKSATLTNAQAIEFFGSMKDAYGQGSDIYSFIPGGWAPALVTWAIGAVISLTADMYEDYYNEALTSGASYEILDVYMPDGTPGSPHTYVIRQKN